MSAQWKKGRRTGEGGSEPKWTLRNIPRDLSNIRIRGGYHKLDGEGRAQERNSGGASLAKEEEVRLLPVKNQNLPEEHTGRSSSAINGEGEGGKNP